MAMFIVESVAAKIKPGKASEWKIKQRNSVVFFISLPRYQLLTFVHVQGMALFSQLWCLRP
jgi:hypothetical protein